MSLKQKTVSGLIWSFVDTMAGQGLPLSWALSLQGYFLRENSG